MAYQVTSAQAEGYIDPEFDNLLWRLVSKEIPPVRERCLAITNSTTSSKQEVAWAHALLGLAALVEGRYEEARDHSKQAIHTPYPISAKAISTYHLALLKLGDSAQACRGLEAFVRQYPTSADALYALGLCYQESKNSTGAWQAFLQAYKARPTWKSPLLAIIELAEHGAAHSQLASILEGALLHIPWELDLRCALATCYLRLGDIDRGLAEAGRFLAFSQYVPVTTPIFERFRAVFNASAANAAGV